MHAFNTSCRRALFWLVGGLSVACATYVDAVPSPLASAGAAGLAGAASAGAASALAGTGGNAGNADGGSVNAPAGGAMTGGSGSGGGADAGMGGVGGAGMSAGGSGGNAGAGGTLGIAGTSGSGGKAGGAGGSGGSGGSGGAIQSCAKNPIPLQSKWSVTASSNPASDPPAQAIDNQLATRWTTGKDQAPGEWLELDFGSTVLLTRLTLKLGSSIDDYPRKYTARFSNTSQNTAAPVLVSGSGSSGVDTVLNFSPAATGRYLLITQTGSVQGLWWSVAEIEAQCVD